MDNNRLFSDMLRELASDVLLPTAIRELDTRLGSEPLPALATLAGEADPGWSREACLFLLLSHARVATGEFAKAIQLLDDPNPFGGNLRVMDLFEILGLEPGLGDTLSRSLELLAQPVR